MSEKPWSHLSHQSLSPSLSKEVFAIERGHGALALPGTPKAVRWILSPEDAFNGGTSLIVQEFSLDSSTPPLPPLPMPTPPPSIPPGHDDTNIAPTIHDATPIAAADIVHTTRTRSIIVPLFDTQISLLNALDSTVELIFKSCQSDVQVGVHLGMMAGELDKDNIRDATTVARTLPRHELLELLEPSIKAQWESIHTLAPAEKKKGFLSLGAIEGADRSKQPEIVLALDLSSEEGGFVDAIETLEGGWRRLTLHISSLFSNVYGEKRKDDLSTIFLSQLGLTLTYEGQAAPSKAPEKEESRALVVVGSLAVVPTWGAVYKGSCVQGLKADGSQVVVVEMNKTEPTIECDFGHQQQKQLGDISIHQQQPELFRPTKSVLKVSSSVTWNIGYPIIGPTLGASLSNTPASLSSEVSPVDYSHYAVYLSLEERALNIDSVRTCKDGGKGNDRGNGEKVFVGTAFTNQYQILQFEIPMDQIIPGYPSRLPGIASTTTDVQRLLTSAEMMDQGCRSIWVWVQGIRRDGRADMLQDWAIGQIL